MNPTTQPEGFVAALASIGAVIGIGQLMAADDPITARLLIGRAIASAGIGAAAGAVMLFAPDAHPVLLYGTAAGLASVGTSTLEYILKNRFGGKPTEDHHE
jgi:hypothetical protein